MITVNFVTMGIYTHGQFNIEHYYWLKNFWRHSHRARCYHFPITALSSTKFALNVNWTLNGKATSYRYRRFG